ncbi:MAG: hypothetical protein JSS81_10890 [Acidobacteria bacterium]|nr:hypothetical protein [Acidobacteriota bacterium]
MKRNLYFCTLIGSLVVCAFGFAAAAAQTGDADYQKRLARDKAVPREKVEQAYAEADKIAADILKALEKDKSGFQIYRSTAEHLKFGVAPGSLGVTRYLMTWRRSNTELQIHVELTLSKTGLHDQFWKGLNGIQMGEFFKVEGIGDEAILVKNVTANLTMTNTDLHFIKGRAMVDVYLRNYRRSTKKNEKELMEIVRLVEPLIAARDNFDD